MQQSGTRNEQHGLEAIGLDGSGKLFWNLGDAALCERSIARGEARLSAAGALAAETGAHRSPNPADRFILREERTQDSVDWDKANALTRDHFDALKTDFLAYAGARTLFAQDLDAGDIPVRVLTEHAWHALVMRNLLGRPDAAAIATFAPRLTVICVPSFKAEPEKHGVRSATVIACDLAEGLVLIGGTALAGEIRGAVHTYLGHALAARGTLALNAAATTGVDGNTALFLGLPGTGKTALADTPERALVADGVLGWSADGIRALEAGCYARAEHVTAAGTPVLFAALSRFGTVLENVPLDAETRQPLIEGETPAESARAAFALPAPATARPEGSGVHPKALFLLSCDTLGVLPPIARLTPAQAIYHFLSGYSATLPGTEAGIEEAQIAFAPGFGAPFLSGAPAAASGMLRDLIARQEVTCWLVNSGWIGGKAGTGRRVPVETTRALVGAALDGTLDAGEWRTDPHFGVEVPKAVEGVDARLLDPARSWASRMDYAKTARQLVSHFSRHFARFESLVDDEVRGAQPSLAIAAE
ncbi:phosphoenolpyruvate carboxykinase (ATP) [Ancylobacter radicis]|uniref:Phosphoenolpyruvate carboxykinase (ATP) n=1 Tax=Ancylobacter radicis TaxID=2836179 RepID=A0ABS5R5B4_9HYPH|nr:phosphoenolpyruvate carboxykinase (ATP) [Ancylobacter radicis]MBS9476844.1 phosphoenolpyruvate carboxykinase (ATP) [Ancylobacter radicis]